MLMGVSACATSIMTDWRGEGNKQSDLPHAVRCPYSWSEQSAYSRSRSTGLPRVAWATGLILKVLGWVPSP